MNILESLEFIEKNWDVCSKDKTISQVLQGSHESLSRAESNFTNDVEKMESQFLQECNQNLKLDDINNNIASTLDLLNNCNNDLFTSLGTLHSLEDSFSSSLSTNVPRDVYDFFTKYLPRISNIKIVTISPDEIYEIHNFLKKYPGLRNMFSMQISFFDLFKNRTLSSYREFIIGHISNKIDREKCLKCYKFYVEINDNNNEVIKKLILDCIKKMVENVMCRLTAGPFPPEPKEIRDQNINTILNLQLLTRENLKIIPEKSKTEFRIIKFIVELPEIIKEQVENLHSIFPDEKELCASAFTNKLHEEYKSYLQLLKINRSESRYETPMVWCFIFRVAAFHRLTVILDSPYKTCIEDMIDDTINIANDNSNIYYREYMNPSSRYFERYNSLRSMITTDNITEPKTQIRYINSILLIIRKYAYPIIERINIYYHNLLKDRKFEKIWYGGIIETIKKYNNLWLIDYLTKLQQSPLFDDFAHYKFKNMEEKYVLKLICYMNYYAGCYEGIYRNHIEPFFSGYMRNVMHEYEGFQENTKIFLNLLNKPIDADFIKSNLDNYINDVVKFTKSKLDMVIEADKENDYFKSVFHLINIKIINNDEEIIEPKIKVHAYRKFIYIFANRFSSNYQTLCYQFKGVTFPDKNVVEEAIMKLLPEKK